MYDGGVRRLTTWLVVFSDIYDATNVANFYDTVERVVGLLSVRGRHFGSLPGGVQMF